MAPDARPREQLEPVADPSELIVGTIGAPPWLETISTRAWLFIVLAALDVAYRVLREAPWSAVDVPPTAVAGLALSVVGGAATVLLPVAILVGRLSFDRAGSWLLQGAVALAAAELLRLAGRGVLDFIVGPASFDSSVFGAEDLLVRSVVITVPAMVLEIFGIARIGLGLRMIAVPTRMFSRIQFAAPAAALAVLLLADLLTIQVTQAQPGSLADALALAYNLLILVAGAVVFVLWAWIATLAYRHDARPWRWIMVGAGAIAIGTVIRAVGWIAGVQWVGPDDAQSILTWFGLAATAAEALGAVLLVVGLARGFEPIDAADGAGTETAEPVGRSLGA